MKVTVLNKKTLTIIGLAAILVVAAIINISLKDRTTTSQSTDDYQQESELDANEEVATSSRLSSLQILTQYELERKTSIEKELQYLDEIINDQNVDKDTLKTATEQKLLVMRNVNIEKTISEILVAKGFSQVTVVCGTDSVNILVNSNELDDSKVAQILDTATSETDTLPENIKIIPLD